MVFFGKHAGSKIIYEIIQTIKPKLVLCGHIHEDPGFSKTNKTVIVNCSMGKRGKGAMIALNKNIIVEMID
jgi:Icc-related predicted phosphoesterase